MSVMGPKNKFIDSKFKKKKRQNKNSYVSRCVNINILKSSLTFENDLQIRFPH